MTAHALYKYSHCHLIPELSQNDLLRLISAASRCQNLVPRLYLLEQLSHDVPVFDTALSDPPLPYQLQVITDNRIQADEEGVMK